MKSLIRFTLINCWHEHDVESEAMWRLYSSSGDGVAVRTILTARTHQLVNGETMTPLSHGWKMKFVGGGGVEA